MFYVHENILHHIQGYTYSVDGIKLGFMSPKMDR